MAQQIDIFHLIHRSRRYYDWSQRHIRQGLRMRFRRLDLNLIVYLDALLAERSVSRAAERVHISQSAMSDALARLRDYFQDKLFVQVGRSMVPTPLAQSMAQPVRDVLLQIESVASSNVQFDPLNSRRKIGILASDYVADVLLNKIGRAHV